MSSALTIEVPTGFLGSIRDQFDGPAPPRWIFEAIVAEAVRNGTISGGYAGELLGLPFTEREHFLKEHGVLQDLSDEELAAQGRAVERALR